MNEEKGLRESWKQAGLSVGHAFRDLGKTILKSAAAGVERASEWATSEEAKAEPVADAAGEPSGVKTAEPVENK